ncbi:hypothetical protein ACTHQ4_04045 [Alkalicoccobacillus gibsonii]|uniref:hypothetical protein n=1 Tax=Alkalicoccobacillus gibsonii TaxID=79881 RepID=UPI003F7C6734
MKHLKWGVLLATIIAILSIYVYVNGNPYTHYQLKQAVTEHFNKDGASRMQNIHMTSKYNREAEEYPYFLEIYLNLNGVHGGYHYYIYENEQVKATKAFSEPLENIDNEEFFSD